MQSGGVFKKGFLILGRVLLNRDSGLCGVANNLVVNVGNVHDVVKFVSALAQVTAQDVHRDKGAKISDVPVVINRGPARIHANLVALQRAELFDLAGQRVVKAQGHEKGKVADRIVNSRWTREKGSNQPLADLFST